jgi:hypothetical protein
MKTIMTILIILGLASSMGCAGSQWKIHGGPNDCIKMCKQWGLEFTAMVGVGSQDKYGEGTTACVCQPASKASAPAISSAQAAAAARITQQAALQDDRRSMPPQNEKYFNIQPHKN